MCGIFAIVSNTIHFNDSHIRNIQQTLKHRGPDSNGHTQFEVGDCEITMIHTRLQINGDTSPQPLFSENGDIIIVINGEIFNWRSLEKELDYTCKKSDCEIVIPLYNKYKNDLNTFFSKLNGQFSFVLYDKKVNKMLIARDPIGVTPMYFGTSGGMFAVASEMKALDVCQEVDIFDPRHYIYTTPSNLTSDSTDLIQSSAYFNILGYENDTEKQKIGDFVLENYNEHKKKLRTLLTDSVRLQLSDVLNNPNCDFGVLLSGGLDSSLIASITVQIAKEMGYTKPVKTFSVGFTNKAPDLLGAKRVSEYLDTQHHQYIFNISSGLNCLDDVVWYTETYDCTSIRASTPMYLLTKRIHHNYPNLKVLFSGELSDELFCYLYGANAPSLSAFQNETVNLVRHVHQFDCLRANKTCMANSIEVRVPFTDPTFVDYVLSLHPKYKVFGDNGRMEKQILRDAFNDDTALPKEILYRKKEQFSDGVSGFNGKEDNWIDALVNYADDYYTDEEFLKRKMCYVINPPDTKEQLYFREIFNRLFLKNERAYSYNNSREKTVKFWYPKWSHTKDPSGRVQNYWTPN